MAITHFQYTPTSQHGSILKSCLSGLETGVTSGNQCLGVMATMIDGDGSNASQFTEVTNKFGFPDNATSKAAWDELNSMMAKINTNADVTNVNAALTQAFNKFR
jgi:tetrahydromethanopterin S-methyltransferase subunit H